MKLRLLLALLAMGALTAFAVDQASARATTSTVSLAGLTSIEPGSPTCAGGTATNSFTFDTGVLHETDLPDGTTHDTLTVQGAFLQVPDDSTQPTYRGHFVFWDGDNFNRNVQVSPNFTTNIQAVGSDGSVIHVHWTFFILVRDGQLQVVNYTFSCH